MKYIWLWWIYVGIVSYIWGYNHIYIHPITNIFRVYGKNLRPISFTFIEGIAKLCMGHCLQIYIVILPAIKLDQQWYLTALQKYIRLLHLLSIFFSGNTNHFCNVRSLRSFITLVETFTCYSIPFYIITTLTNCSNSSVNIFLLFRLL